MSNSGARRLREITPRQWHYEQLHPLTKNIDVLEFGSAVHTLILGTGAPVIEVATENWQNTTAQRRRKHLRASGAIPLRTEHFNKAATMARAVRRHPLVAKLLESGAAETTVYWRDKLTNVMLRLRADWIHINSRDQVIILDFKTTDSADPYQFARSVAKFGYDLQQDFYQRGFSTHGIRTTFLFVAISKDPPHIVTVFELTDIDLKYASTDNRNTIDRYAQFLHSNTWPDYGPGIHPIRIPSHYRTRRETIRECNPDIVHH
ncbi:PD-(D/E)XK nuclease-like domain-containing protein [Nocardia sp. CNY236]|uniref:PD-(D/E)XK nuclease-like domain-containing protein n=1 Tax=Nocardia sp. CNY236 TaxID=1169152 RepID=UPI0018CBB9B5|nr:PD-(D/E)XK nuclease-like domain-containing protein [Nocardia sp. CNY236]